MREYRQYRSIQLTKNFENKKIPFKGNTMLKLNRYKTIERNYLGCLILTIVL